MKIKLIFLSTVASFFSLVTYALETGTCQALPESKVYLSDHFTLPYPKEATFTCLYECLGQNENQPHEVLGTSNVRVRNQQDDALKVVCQGVKLKSTAWGYDFDKVESFYAYDTKIKELRFWAQEFVSRNNAYEQTKLLKLKSELEEVVAAYELAARSPVDTAKSFFVASELLKKISRPLPENTQALDDALNLLSEQGLLIKSDPLANRLSSGILKSLAQWRFKIR